METSEIEGTGRRGCHRSYFHGHLHAHKLASLLVWLVQSAAASTPARRLSGRSTDGVLKSAWCHKRGSWYPRRQLGREPAALLRILYRFSFSALTRPLMAIHVVSVAAAAAATAIIPVKPLPITCHLIHYAKQVDRPASLAFKLPLLVTELISIALPRLEKSLVRSEYNRRRTQSLRKQWRAR